MSRDFPEQADKLPAILELLDAEIPVAFIARYRKERTGGVAEARVREIRRRRGELLALEERRQQVIELLEAEGRLVGDLRRKIQRARTSAGLDEVLRPFLETAPKEEAEDRLAPLAAAIESAETPLPLGELAGPFISAEHEIPDEEAAVTGALSVLAKRMAETRAARSRLKSLCLSSGKLVAKKVGEEVPGKYENYQDFSQPVKNLPSHRVLAILRGVREKALEVELSIERDRCLQTLGACLLPGEEHPYRELLQKAVEEAYDRFLRKAVDEEVLDALRKRADTESVRIFAQNLEQLLLAPPAGPVVVMGVEPGVRRGCKIAVVDGAGKYKSHASIFPFPPRGKQEAAVKTVGDFCRHHQVKLIALGSGPGCREVERFLKDFLKQDEGLEARLTIINEAGSAAYAGSAPAKREFPKLDPRVRAAISIARRLQDPLAELVKIEARSIGVGPYQRDVDQALVARALGDVVEHCVCRVGVDVNSADAQLLRHVSGIGPRLAKAIVAHRKEKGLFRSLQDLLAVPGFDEKAFLLASGFLRVRDGTNPLDRTSIHPDSYPVVESMAEKLGVETGALLGNETALASLDPGGFVSDRAGLPTVLDIFEELRLGGTDPRGTFELPAFREDLTGIEDLKEGMELEGVVTNIATFGAFVDVGIDQEGLVHVSELSDEFVSDPGGVVTVGKNVKVRVIGVDRERKRLSLSMRTPGAKKPRRTDRPRGEKPSGRRGEREGQRGKRRPAAKKGGKKRDKDGKPRRERSRDDRGGRAPRVIEQKAKRDPEPEIDPDLPEEEVFRLKLERLRKKFKTGR
ncbi:MAG: helix-hairpin-helix domain-containing protein [Planctomycetota bacterium]